MKYKIPLLICLIAFCSLSKLSAQGPNWQNVGPIAFPTKTIWQVHGIGRCSEMQFHPSDPNKMYVASASGGLWKSIDKGKTWTSLGTDQIIKVSSASLAVDPSSDQIIYWGTGDDNYYSNGYGVYKTTDEGKTWISANTGMGNTLVTEILIDPSNTQNILAATNNGIYKSTNGGLNWSLKTNAGLNFQDMTFKANKGTNTVFACTKSAFFRSTNKGETWQQITDGLIMDGEGARVAVSPSDSNVVYVGVTKPYGAIFRSSNGGTSFVSKRVEMNLNLVAYTADATDNGQGNYNFDIGVDPNNSNTVYLCSHIVWASTDGGAHWTQKQTGWAGDLHTDQHQILFNPYVAGELWNVNDGGVWKNNTGGTGAWTPMSDGIAATEIYHGSASNIYRQMMGIGTQDNGGFYYIDGVWYNNRGGDYGDVYQSDYGSNSFYHSSEDSRDVNLGATSTDLKLPFTPSESYPASYAFSPANINVGYVYNPKGNVVYRSSNLLAASPTWTTVFTCPASIKDMKADATNASLLYVLASDNNLYILDNALASGTYITASVPSSSSGKTFLAPMASANGLYLVINNKTYKSTNKGITWTDISSGLPTGNVVKLASDIKSSVDAVYYCTALGVYYYDRTRTSWINYSQGLPIVCNITDMDVFNNGIQQGYVRVYTYGRGAWESPVRQTEGPPRINITSPATLSSFTTGSSITIKTNANDVGGSITQVEFFNGTQSLGFGSANSIAGPANNAFGTGGSHGGGQYLVFTALNPFTLKSVKVYATGAKDRTITLKDASGALIDSKTINIPDGESIVTLNLTIPKGVNLRLGVETGADLFRNSAGAIYPYTVPDVLSITGNSAGIGNEAYYYYFYDWKIQGNEYVITWDNVSDGNYTITAVATDNDLKTTKSEAIVIGVSSQVCNSLGYIGREEWDNISGGDIIPSVFNTTPSSTSTLTKFEGPSEVGENYQSRIRGYICAPITGNYTFWISGDDHSELWLSSNNLPANKRLICSVPIYSSNRGWDDHPEQKSATIALRAGTNYYIEAIHKEEGGGDHLAVGWQTPGGIFERPISGTRLSPYITLPDSNAVGTFYQDCSYGGYAVDLTEGNYTSANLISKGISNNDISSLIVKTGYEVVLFDGDNFTGDSIAKPINTSCLVNDNFNDRVSSIKVRKTKVVTDIETIYEENTKTMVYPNPIEQSTTIRYHLPNASFVSINLYNNRGQEVAQLLNKETSEGTHELEYDASNLSDGIYLLKVTTNKTNETIPVFVGKNKKPKSQNK